MRNSKTSGKNWAPRALSVAVVGLSELGESLLTALNEKGCRVLGIDRSEALVERISPTVPCTTLDASDESALRDIEINAYDTVVVAIDTNIESSIMVTAALKRTGVRHVICQAANSQHGQVLQRIGAGRIIDPQVQAGRRLASELSARPPLQQRESSPGLGVSLVVVRPDQHGQKLHDLDLGGPGVLVLLIQRAEETLFSPPIDAVVKAEDYVLLLGRKG